MGPGLPEAVQYAPPSASSSPAISARHLSGVHPRSLPARARRDPFVAAWRPDSYHPPPVCPLRVPRFTPGAASRGPSLSRVTPPAALCSPGAQLCSPLPRYLCDPRQSPCRFWVIPDSFGRTACGSQAVAPRPPVANPRVGWGLTGRALDSDLRGRAGDVLTAAGRVARTSFSQTTRAGPPPHPHPRRAPSHTAFPHHVRVPAPGASPAAYVPLRPPSFLPSGCSPTSRCGRSPHSRVAAGPPPPRSSLTCALILVCGRSGQCSVLAAALAALSGVSRASVLCLRPLCGRLAAALSPVPLAPFLRLRRPSCRLTAALSVE